jgi:hypothetical protein
MGEEVSCHHCFGTDYLQPRGSSKVTAIWKRTGGDQRVDRSPVRIRVPKSSQQAGP